MAGAGDTGGLKTALTLLGAAGRLDDDGEGETADLFEAAAPLSLPLARVEPASGAGRPKGARNKSTDAWVRYYLSRYRSPLTALGELYSRPLEDLVDELQRMADKHKSWIETKDGGRWERVAISPLEVLKMQRDAAVAILPYIHKRQPMALEIDQRQAGIVVLGHLDVSGMGGDDEFALPLAPIEQNQGVTELQPDVSDGNKSETVADQSRDRDAH
jgi:hypothetical protein